VPDLFLLTSDPLLQQRVAKADVGNKGRISRRDILDALQREASGGQGRLGAEGGGCGCVGGTGGLPQGVTAGLGQARAPLGRLRGWTGGLGLCGQAACSPGSSAPRALPSPCPPAAKQKLRRGLVAGSILLAFCLLMLAANAALTYAVVAMSKDTSVQAGGVMTARASGEVVGASAASTLALGWPLAALRLSPAAALGCPSLR
jgi:hypothetical protein